MASLSVISADSHVMEPADLWTQRVDERFRDRAPQVVKNENRPGWLFSAPGIRPFPVAGGFASGRSGKELREHMTKGYEAARPSGWDPAERIKDQDIDGVVAEVIYTTLGMPLFSLDDVELQRECFRVYNDWVAEFGAYDRKRLCPIGLVSLEDVGAGVAELERIAKLGLRGAMIWGAPPRDRPYHLPLYDPFWQAASEHDLPLSLHVITAKDQGQKRERREDTGDAGTLGSLRFLMGAMAPVHEVQRTLSSMIFGGVFERFPRLKIVSAENDSGWVAHFMYRLDHMFEKFGKMSEKAPLVMPPSEYVRRNLWVTFQDDLVGPMTYRYFGADNYMWASDFPHADSTWPHSLDVIEKDFAGVPDEVKRNIVCENARKLYRMELQ